MSRNLCQTTCYYCSTEPKLIELPRPITKDEAFVYFDEYEGMLVANAECPLCEAKYLAWIDESGRRPDPTYGMMFRRAGSTNEDGTPVIQDLSFRSSFNDEPGDDDLPKWKIETRSVRVGPWKS